MEAGNRPVADRDVALPAFVADSTPAHPCHGHAGKLIRVTRLSARDLIDAVTDPGTYQSWDSAVDATDRPPGYRAELEGAELRSGIDEAVLTGTADIRGNTAALIISEFSFLGGSIGTATAARIVTAVRRATAEQLPLIAAPSSGGTRMQEGTPAFVQMVEISRAIVAHKAAGLPYLVYLRNPTVGGVFASWGPSAT